jgi:hypothetical protein
MGCYFDKFPALFKEYNMAVHKNTKTFIFGIPLGSIEDGISNLF